MAAALLNPIFQDEELAREHLEALRWANGRVCPHCGAVDESGAVESKNHKPGLYYCNACAKTFTVTVGTLFERSHMPLNKWLMAFHLMAASKKGISAKQMERMLGVTYKTAWFMCHRIREAMNIAPTGPLGTEGGMVEVDETYWGNVGKQQPGARGGDHKMKIVSLVDRDSGQKHSHHVANVTAATVTPILKAQISADAKLMTDEAKIYKKVGTEFADHYAVNHSAGEYVNPIQPWMHTNTVESSFAILKRGLYGTFHSVSEQHLQRYATEFDFRWNTRAKLGFSDSDRAAIALAGIAGKRLTYRQSACQ